MFPTTGIWFSPTCSGTNSHPTPPGISQRSRNRHAVCFHCLYTILWSHSSDWQNAEPKWRHRSKMSHTGRIWITICLVNGITPYMLASAGPELLQCKFFSSSDQTFQPTLSIELLPFVTCSCVHHKNSGAESKKYIYWLKLIFAWMVVVDSWNAFLLDVRSFFHSSLAL